MNPTRKVLDKPTRHLHREARFADPPWTRDRDQAHILTQQELFGGSYFFLPPYKPGPLHGKTRWAGLHLLNWFLRKAVESRNQPLPKFLPKMPGDFGGLRGRGRQANRGSRTECRLEVL